MRLHAALLAGALTAAAGTASAQAPTTGPTEVAADRAELDRLARLARLNDSVRAYAYAPLTGAPDGTTARDVSAEGLPLALIAAEYAGGRTRVDLDLGAAVDGEAGSAGAGVVAAVDAAYELPLCRIVHAAASGQLGVARAEGDGAPARQPGDAPWSATLGGCLPLPFQTVQVAYTRRDRARTTLLARAGTPLDRRVIDEVALGVRMARFRGTHHTVAIAPWDIELSWTRALEAGARLEGGLVTGDLPIVAWDRHGAGLAGEDQRWTFMHVRMGQTNTDARDEDVDTVAFLPVTGTGVRLRPDLVLDLEVGVVIGTIGERMVEGISPIRDEVDLHVDAGVRGARGPAQGGVRFTRSLYPLFDAQLAREARLAADATYARDRARVRVEAFGARADVLRGPRGGDRAFIGGAAADLGWELHPHLALFGRVEAARTLAALRAEDPVGARPELRATVGVTAHYGARWPR